MKQQGKAKGHLPNPLEMHKPPCFRKNFRLIIFLEIGDRPYNFILKYD